MHKINNILHILTETDEALKNFRIENNLIVQPPCKGQELLKMLKPVVLQCKLMSGTPSLWA